MKIAPLSSGWNVEPLRRALEDHPHVWNQHPYRTQEGSPHAQVDDIWVRYREHDAVLASPVTANAEHESVWYPAAYVLNVKPLVFDLMRAVNGERLGGILITRIPPGKKVLPHVDHGWHARYYEKFALQIQATPLQRFCFEGEELVTAPGDLFWFDNAHTHWVDNDSDVDRITLICCIRRSH